MAQKEVSIFTWIPEYNPEIQASNCNTVFHRIVNCVPKGNAFHYNWYRKDFWPNTGEDWDKYQWAYDKRPWVQTHYNNDYLLDVSWFSAPIVKDKIVIDGIAYYLVFNNSLECCILAECHASRSYDQCYPSYVWCNWSQLVKITNDHKINECTHDRLLKTFWPKRKKFDQVFNYWFIIERKLIGNDYIYILYDAQTLKWPNASIEVWDIIHIIDNSTNGVTWFSRPVAWLYTDEASWIENAIILDWDASISDQVQYVAFEVYEEMWYTISFATIDWIYQVHDLDCSTQFEESKYWMTGWSITAMELFNDRLAYISNWVFHLWEWWYNWWVFLSTNDIVCTDFYTDMIQIWNMLYLLWPDAMWVVVEFVYQDSAWARSSTYRMFNIPWASWYFNKHSYVIRDWNLYMVTKEWRWWWARVVNNNTNTSSSIVNFDYEFLDLWRFWINTDLSILDRTRWDRVYVSSIESNIYITMLNWWPERTANNDTKVLVYEFERKRWHTRIFEKIYMERFVHWTWIWPLIYCWWWDTDNWESIQQIVWFYFGDISHTADKYVDRMVISLWGNSRLWLDSKIKMYVDHNSYQQEFEFNEWDSLRYIRDINADWSEKKLPFWASVEHWNWFPWNKYMNLWSEVDSFKEYEENQQRWPADSCYWEQDSLQAWWTKQSFNNPSDRWWYKHSKYWIIWFDIWLNLNNLYVEFIADNKDRINFMSYTLIYEFANLAILSRDNVYAFKTSMWNYWHQFWTKKLAKNKKCDI